MHRNPGRPRWEGVKARELPGVLSFLSPSHPFLCNTCFLNTRFPLWFADFFFFLNKDQLANRTDYHFLIFKPLPLRGAKLSFKRPAVEGSQAIAVQAIAVSPPYSRGSCMESGRRGAMCLWLWLLCFLPGEYCGETLPANYQV